MAKTLKDLFDADPTAGDDLTAADLVLVEPDILTGETTSKAITLDQLSTWISGRLLSQPGSVQFANATESVNEGSSVDIEIIREDYLAYPSTTGSCVLNVSNELTETTDYSLQVDGIAFSNNGIINWAQYELSKVVTFTSVADSITTDTDVTLTLSTFTSISGGANLSTVLTVVNQP